MIDCQTRQIEEESGDVIDALANGTYDRSKVIELQEVVAGRASGRNADDRIAQITLFKSVGTAVQDVAAGTPFIKRRAVSGSVPKSLIFSN